MVYFNSTITISVRNFIITITQVKSDTLEVIYADFT